MIRLTLCVWFAAIVACGRLENACAADWPSWRGPTRDGHAPADQILVTNIPTEPKTVWKSKIGPGLASPVVAGKIVLCGEGTEGKEVFRAVDRENGNEVWRAEVDETFHDNQGPDGPRCTPLIDGDRAYVVSCRGRLTCLSLADGRKLWSVSYVDDFGAVFIGEKGNIPGAARHGNNGTPLIVGERLFTQAGGTNGAGIVCLNKRDGKLLWKSQNDQAAYGSPALAKLAGADQLLCFTAEGLVALHPEDGALLWRVPIKTAYARHVTAPVWDGDVVVVSSHQVGMIGTRVSKDGSGFKAEQAWLSKDVAMNFASPVAIGKHLYGLGPRKNLICVEIATGKQMWSQDDVFTTSADKAYGGFLVLGQNIMCLTDAGLLVLFSGTPEKYAEVGRAQVCGVNWCNPAYADGRLYLRDGNKQSGGDLMSLQLAP